MAKMTKQELQHDDLEDIGEAIAGWYRKNSTWVTSVLFVALAAFIGWKVYDKLHHDKLAVVSAEYGKMLENFNRAVIEKDPAKRKELFATAATDAQRIAKDYANLPLGTEAYLMEGNAYYTQALTSESRGEDTQQLYKKAIEAFDRYTVLVKTPEEKAVGQLAIANANESLGFITSKDLTVAKNALDNYTAVIKAVPGTAIAAEAQLGKARLLQAQVGKEAEALAELGKVAAERKVPEVKDDAALKSVRDDKGLEVDVAEAKDIKTFADFSYAYQARKAAESIKSAVPQ
ncbi:MAG: tetratricopeptide repeat protein [Candidatus Sumerlaeaceae bacterium]|nr:tetratricopeptide repeat protein [Candidatus Sumerlaeaceae bacterium]